jgi:RNA polymerase sigma factor (sigma-70 family)
MSGREPERNHILKREVPRLPQAANPATEFNKKGTRVNHPHRLIEHEQKHHEQNGWTTNEVWC